LCFSSSIHNANKTISIPELLREVWGENDTYDSHLLQVNLGRLRRKLKDNAGTKYIKTRPGLGYIFYTIKPGPVD